MILGGPSLILRDSAPDPATTLHHIFVFVFDFKNNCYLKHFSSLILRDSAPDPSTTLHHITFAIVFVFVFDFKNNCYLQHFLSLILRYSPPTLRHNCQKKNNNVLLQHTWVGEMVHRMSQLCKNILKGSEIYNLQVNQYFEVQWKQFVTKTEVLKWFWRKFQQIMSNDGRWGGDWGRWRFKVNRIFSSHSKLHKDKQALNCQLVAIAM